MNWDVIDKNRANFKVNHAYTYMQDGIISCLSTELVKDKLIIRLGKVGKGKTNQGKKIVLFDDEGAKQDAIDFIFMLNGFDWEREDIKEIKLNFKK